MKITKIKDNIYQYEFIEDENNPIYVVNITVIIADDKALIIDTAFSSHAYEVKKDLINKGIIPEIVILSHFHPDHIDGSKEFEGCKFIGSEFYKFNFDNCKEWHPEGEFVEPSILVQKDMNIEFKNHKIRLIHTPGHCKCSITTVIDDEIMHVGDLIMRTGDGKEMLPYICQDGNFEDHIRSLEMLLELNCNFMLLSHGDYIIGQNEINESIDERLYYLKKVKESKGNLSLEECLKYDSSKYSSLNLHEINIKQI